MSIRPPSDIILEVAQAADPTRLAEATGRLREIAAARGRDAPAFETQLAAAGERRPAAPAPSPFDADRARVRLANLDALGAPRPIGAGPDLPAARVAAAPDSPAVRFEAFVLREVVETMLPDAPSVFGEGSAGSIWKGFLAEEIGAEIARAGGVGIAETIAQSHPALARAAAAHAALFPADVDGDAAPTPPSAFFAGLYRA